MERANEILSQMLVDWRKKKGLKIEAAAKEMGVSPAAWGHWERGIRFPTGRQLTLLSLYTGVPLCQMFCSSSGNCDDCPDGAKWVAEALSRERSGNPPTKSRKRLLELGQCARDYGRQRSFQSMTTRGHK